MKSLSNVRIYGDELSAVYVGPKTATLPEGLEKPSDEFLELGWLSEDGVEAERTSSSNDFTAYQGARIVRTRRTGVKDTLKFQCLEETWMALDLYYPGSEFATDKDGITKIKVKGISRNDKKWIFDSFDGDVHKRYSVVLGEVSEAGSVVHRATEMTVYEFTVNLMDFEIITNNPAMVRPAGA